jgi:hypothetical protein
MASRAGFIPTKEPLFIRLIRMDQEDPFTKAAAKRLG